MAIRIQEGRLSQNAKTLIGLKIGSLPMILNQDLSLVQPEALIKVNDETGKIIGFSFQIENDEAFIYIMQPYEFNEFKDDSNEAVILETAPNEADVYISKLSPTDYNTFTKNWTEVWMLNKDTPKHLGSIRSIVKTAWFEDGYYYIVWFKEKVSSPSEAINAQNFNLELKSAIPESGTSASLQIAGESSYPGTGLSLKVTVTGGIEFENTIDKDYIDVSFYHVGNNELLVSGQALKNEDGIFEFTLEYISEISDYEIKMHTPEKNGEFQGSPSYEYFTGFFSEKPLATTSASVNELTWMLVNGTLYQKDSNNNKQPYTEKVIAYLSEKPSNEATRSNLVGPFPLEYKSVTNEDGTELNVNYGRMQGLGPNQKYYLYVAQLEPELIIGENFTLSEETCLAEDTLITMADGSEKQIQHIVVGDYVLSKDKTAARVTKVRKTYGQTYHTLYTFEDGTIIDETGPHCFYNLEQDYWVTLEKWKIGEHCIDINGNAVALISKERIDESKKQCGLWVDGNTYFANGLLSGSAEYNLNLLEEIDLDKAVEMMNTVNLGMLLKYMKPEEYSE